MSRSAILGLVLAVAVAGLLVAGFLAAADRVEVERDVGYQGEARSNPYLAFERLVGELGVPATRPGDPLRLPPSDHVLLALGAHHPPGPRYREKLLAWVAEGGHLLLVPAGDGRGRSRDPLLAELGVGVEWPVDEVVADDEAAGAAGEGEPAAGDDDGDGEDGAGEDGESGADGEAGEGSGADGETPFDVDEIVLPPVDLAAAAESPSRRVAMPEWPRLHDLDEENPSFTSGRPDGASLVGVAWGEGRVTVLADASFLTNRRLGRLDHARFAWDLVVAAGDPAGLAIVDWRRAMPLGTLAARRGWPLAAGGLVVLVAWLAARGARFGPPLPPEPPPRRSLLEHVRASGAFLWRRGQSEELLAACRAAVARRVDLVHADWGRRRETDRVLHLARLANLPAGTVAAALDGDAAEPADFTRTVATLERLRRSL